MPAYAAADVDIRLSVCSLTDSTTDQPCTNTGALHGANLRKHEEAFGMREVLAETYLPYHNYNGPLRFLGEKLEAPFKLVKVGAARKSSFGTQASQNMVEETLQASLNPQVWDGSSSPLSSICSSVLSSLGETPPMSPVPAAKSPSSEPQAERKALRLSVALSASSLKRFDDDIRECLKIEVFFNGEFAVRICHCKYECFARI